MIACGAICLTIAFERYYSAVQTAKAFADLFEGIEFSSVSIPMVSKVCGVAGVVMLVAGILLLFDTFKGKSEQNDQDGLLKN